VKKPAALKISEADVGRACDSLMDQMGYLVERYEQRRASKICAGLPDRRYIRPTLERVWVELKAPGGKLTYSQYRWLLSELISGGMATVINNAEQLAHLASLMNADERHAARLYCRCLLEECWARGERPS